MNIKLTLIVAALFVFALFVVQNAQVVTVNFLFWKIEASRAIVLMATFVFGLIAGWIVAQIFRKQSQLNYSIQGR